MAPELIVRLSFTQPGGGAVTVGAAVAEAIQIQQPI